MVSDVGLKLLEFSENHNMLSLKHRTSMSDICDRDRIFHNFKIRCSEVGYFFLCRKMTSIPPWLYKNKVPKNILLSSRTGVFLEKCLFSEIKSKNWSYWGVSIFIFSIYFKISSNKKYHFSSNQTYKMRDLSLSICCLVTSWHGAKWSFVEEEKCLIILIANIVIQYWLYCVRTDETYDTNSNNSSR